MTTLADLERHVWNAADELVVYPVRPLVTRTDKDERALPEALPA